MRAVRYDAVGAPPRVDDISAPECPADGVVVDIGRASEVLGGILSALSYRNLDDEPEFAGVNTTTERLCSVIAERLVAAARDGRLGKGGSQLSGITATLHESHIAWASFEVDL